jgi:hypothetical protein
MIVLIVLVVCRTCAKILCMFMHVVHMEVRAFLIALLHLHVYFQVYVCVCVCV